MDEDYFRFCMKCRWNNVDFGCISPVGAEVYQCPMYMHYHPDKVKEFEKDVEEWCDQLDNK